MKCMKENTTLEIKRVSDERALELSGKGWSFVPKSEWKACANTTWVKSTVPANPMSDKKTYSDTRKNYRK